MNWPVFNADDAYYLDIGRHFVEKRGLYLNRYARWEHLGNSSSHQRSFIFIALIAIILALLV